MNNLLTENEETKSNFISGYAPVNGLEMYYEIHGTGSPLVLIHGGGSTIQTTFGRVLNSFAVNRQVIAVELQGHGHTADIDRPETFEQDADDVADLLKYLKIGNADFFGFSNGAHTTIEIAIRHPDLVRKIVLGATFYKREGAPLQFWESLPLATLKDMPQQLQDGYKRASPNQNDLIKMFEKDRTRMVNFKGWTAEDISSISVPALVIANDADVPLPEHTVEMWRLLPDARLAILPGKHGAFIGEVTTEMENSRLPDLTVIMIEEFLDEPLPK